MALSPEAKYSNFTKSIRRYFVNNLETTEGIKVFFDTISDVPEDGAGTKLDKWIIFEFDDYNPGTLAECFVIISMFTRNDAEYDDLNALHDTVMDYIVDEDSTDGLVSIPLYDTSSWTQVGGIKPFISNVGGGYPSKDRTKIKQLFLLCKWGSK